MKRRDVLKMGFLATASAAVAFPIGIGGTGQRYLETEDQDLDKKERSARAVFNLKEKYNIPTTEQAADLLREMKYEAGAYMAGGALIGSVTRSIHNEAYPDEKRKTLHRVANVLMGVGASMSVAYPAKDVIDGYLKDSPLTKPETLITKFGMDIDNAQKFSDDYSRSLAGNTTDGALGAVVMQEILSYVSASHEDAKKEGEISRVSQEHNDSIT